jgi:hypothetical protein
VKANLKRKAPKASAQQASQASQPSLAAESAPAQPASVQPERERRHGERRHGERRHGDRRLHLVPPLSPETIKLLREAVAAAAKVSIPPIPPTPMPRVLAEPDPEAKFEIVPTPQIAPTPVNLPAPHASRANAAKLLKLGLIIGAGWLLFADAPPSRTTRARAARAQAPSKYRRRD